MIDRRSVPQTAYLIDVFGQDGATESKADAVGMCRMTWRKPTVSKFDGMCRRMWRKPNESKFDGKCRMVWRKPNESKFDGKCRTDMEKAD